MVSLIISHRVFHSLSRELRKELLEKLQAAPGSGSDDVPFVEATNVLDSADGEEGPVELSVAQTKKLLAGCGDKTRTALEVIARNPSNCFLLSQIADELSCEHNELRGVWGGITRRVRNVLDDPEADFIWWSPTDDDYEGQVAEITHRSLKKAFNTAS